MIGRTKYLAAIIAVMITGCAGAEKVMAQSDTISQNDQAPLILTGPQAVLLPAAATAIDIVSQEGRLGSGDALLSREGRVSLNTPLVFSQALETIVNPDGDRFYLLLVGFTLEVLKKRRCKNLEITISLDTPGVKALSLYPERVMTKEDVNQTFSLDMGFSVPLPIGQAATSKIGLSRTLKFEQLKPQVTSFLRQGDNFSWKYTGDGQQPVAEGDYRVAALLRAPRAAEKTSVNVNWNLSFEQSWTEWRPIEVSAAPVRFDVPLH